jgi:hypothetical protein
MVFVGNMSLREHYSSCIVVSVALFGFHASGLFEENMHEHFAIASHLCISIYV